MIAPFLRYSLYLSYSYIESVYPKCHFIFMINWKTKFKILYLFSFLIQKWKWKFNKLPISWGSIYKKIKNEIQYLFFFFHFQKKNEKRNTTNTSDFIFQWRLSKHHTVTTQFVTFKPLSYCFKETIGFDVNASFASRP